MCTAFAFYNEGMYFGRNMDIEYHFGEQVAVTPRKFCFSTKRAGAFKTKFAMIGMANVTDGYPLYAEAMNEKGLCAAGLNFPANAVYAAEEVKGKISLAPYEFIPYVLGNCTDVLQAKAKIAKIELIDIPFAANMPVAPLHWIIADASCCIVVERTERGLAVYDDPFCLLTNNPPFPFHEQNVRQYLHLSSRNVDNTFAEHLGLTPFAQGAGAIGLPGDFSSASRFVKALFCKENSKCPADDVSCVSQVFHILETVAMPRGAVITDDGRADSTIYACCADTLRKTYYYKTYDSFMTVKIQLTEERMNAAELITFPLRTQPYIFQEN